MHCGIWIRWVNSRTPPSQRSLATWLTVAANEQNDDWPAPVSLVSVQPVIGWLKDEVARHGSHIEHRPCPHGNLPLPCIVRNVVWYCVKYSSLKSLYVLQSHPASIPNHKTKFCGSVVWVTCQSQSGVPQITLSCYKDLSQQKYKVWSHFPLKPHYNTSRHLMIWFKSVRHT